ncbi:hypothetical protein [Caudoviricetes sp.]|nr:hypothetical protein [Caudoviricetes sp.]
MAQDSALSLQIAHIAALRADATLVSFVGTRVYDYVPEKSPYPYIVYHITDSDEWDTTTDNGDEHSVYVHVFDDAEGSKRARRIMQRVYELLHDVTTYPLTDHNLVNSRRVMRAMEREGQLYHGIGLFRAVTEEN